MRFWASVLYGWWCVWLFLAGCVLSLFLALTGASFVVIAVPFLIGLAVWVVDTIVARLALKKFMEWERQR